MAAPSATERLSTRTLLELISTVALLDLGWASGGTGRVVGSIFLLVQRFAEPNVECSPSPSSRARCRSSFPEGFWYGSQVCALAVVLPCSWLAARDEFFI